MCDKGHLQLRSGRRPYNHPHFVLVVGTHGWQFGTGDFFFKISRERWSDEATYG